jgi:nucleoid-associated protein YgaU
MGVAQCYGQDVAEAAKQERARKEAQQKKSKHVYTEEDLKRAQILTPEDRAELEAKKNQPALENSQQAADGSPVANKIGNATVAPPAEAPAIANDANHFDVTPNIDLQPLPPDAPLGDVARRFRQMKLSQDLQRSAEFHLPFAEAPVFASPKPPLQPLRPPLPVIKPSRPSPVFKATSPSPAFKANSPRLAPLPPAMQPSGPSLPVLNPTHPRFAPSQPLVKRSPFARPRTFVFAPPRINPSQPLATPAAPSLRPYVPVAPTQPAAPIAKSHPATPLTSAASARLNRITVQPGDSLWKLAAQNLGQGLRWHDLRAVNPGILNPDHIVAGTQIYLPAAVSSPRIAVKFTVRAGDTLSQIAQSQLGHASYAACIARANPTIRDANRIYVGQSLLLPAACKP